MPLTLTASNILWIQQCPHRFEKLAEKRQFGKVISQSQNGVLAFSTACHAALRDLYNPQKPGDVPHEENIVPAIRTAFAASTFYKDSGGRQQDMRRAHKLISRYMCEDLTGPDTLAVELSSNHPVEIGGKVAFRVSARLDRIVRCEEPSTLKIIDYKITSSLRGLDVFQVWLNLISAKLAFPENKYFILELANLTDEGTEVQTYFSRDLVGVHKQVVAMVENYEGMEVKQACPSDYCEWCQLRDECESKKQPATLADIAFEE